MTRGTRRAGVAAMFALAVLLWAHRIRIERPTAIDFGAADLIHYFEPLAAHLHREYAAGTLPLWNPYQLAGVPLLALHQPGVLYPPNVVLYGMLPAARALEAHAVLHLALAGAGTWLFAGRLGLAAAGAAAAALAFMLSAQLLKTVYNPASLATIAWLPLLLWAVDGLVRERTRRFAAAVALIAAVAFLGGYAQGTVHGAAAAAAYGAVATALWVPRGSRNRVVGLVALALVAALGLVAAQLLPSLELARNGVRGLEGLSLAQAGYGSLEPTRLFAPWVMLPGREAWEGPAWVTWRAASVPALALPLALAAVVGRWRPLGLFFAAVSAVCGLLMLGPEAWVYRAYHALPVGALFRVPVRFDFVYAFAVALLVALGAQTVREAVARLLGKRVGTAVAILLTLAVGLDRYARARFPFAHPATGGPAPYEAREFAELLRHDAEMRRGFVVERRVLTRKLGTRYGVPVVPDYEATLPHEYERYFTGAPGGGYHPWHGEVQLAGPPWEFARTGRAPADVVRLLDLMSVGTYVIDPTTPAAWRRDIEAVVGGPSAPLGRGRVIARRQGLPRAYVLHDVVVEPDPDRAIDVLLSAGFDPRRRAVVAHALSPLETPDAPEEVHVVDESTSRVRVRATCAASCLLVATDLSYPGWHGTVDGRRADIVTTNVLYRGVRLEAGTHEVVFTYSPASFVVGAAVSLATAAALGWMLLRRG